MINVIEFIVTTLVVYFFYYIFMISKYDKNGKLKKKREHKLINKLKDWFQKFIFNTTSEKEEILNRGRKNKKIKEAEEDIKFPSEVEILIARYHVDLSKFNYKHLLKVIGLMCSIDIGLVITIISLVPTNNIYIQLLVGGVLIIPVILISYSILGNYYKKKGLVVKNGKRNVGNKKNRK